MRLVVSWLRDFVDVKASAEEIAETLALRGFEVASIEPLDGGDAVIDFEVTANRPDCLSVIGLAREVATAYDLPLALPSHGSGGAARLAPLPSRRLGSLTVTIEDAELCPRYAARRRRRHGGGVAGLDGGAPAGGRRPADQPDRRHHELRAPRARPADARLRSRHARRRGRSACGARKPGETITTLDGVERKLDADMLVIADRDRAQAVAGVMGGAASEVSGATRRVAFESAYFKPASVRRTSKRLGLKTEASSRFERGADINAPVVALAARGRADAADRRRRSRRTDRRLLSAAARAAAAASAPRAARAPARRRRCPTRDVDAHPARRSGSTSTPAADGWDVVAPTFRVDLLREVDLIEEVGRHYGFDKLEPTFPADDAAARRRPIRASRAISWCGAC